LKTHPNITEDTNITDSFSSLRMYSRSHGRCQSKGSVSCVRTKPWLGLPCGSRVATAERCGGPTGRDSVSPSRRLSLTESLSLCVSLCVSLSASPSLTVSLSPGVVQTVHVPRGTAFASWNSDVAQALEVRLTVSPPLPHHVAFLENLAGLKRDGLASPWQMVTLMVRAIQR
jgi:hypothetical protein